MISKLIHREVQLIVGEVRMKKIFIVFWKLKSIC